MDLILPYGVGDLAESRCFTEGYRGAWFRCKIHKIQVMESRHLELYLEYIDYPGESKEWVKLFQKDPARSEQQASDQIMIRPSFPRWYRNDEVFEEFSNYDVVAIVNETWKVGDMVDWLAEGCYWSANITNLINEDEVEVELLKPPLGEGQRYTASRKDLRPTLDWSLERGWTVPLSLGEGKSWRVARLVHRILTESERSEEENSDGYSDDNGGDGQQLHMTSSNIMQPSLTSSQPADMMQNQNVDVQDQYLQTMADIRCKLKDLLKRTLLMERRAALFGKWAWGRA